MAYARCHCERGGGTRVPCRLARAQAFRWIGGHPVLDYVNTAAWHADGTVCTEHLHHYFGLVGWGTRAGVIPDDLARALCARAARRPVRTRRVVRDARSLRSVLRESVLARAAGRPLDPPAFRELDQALRTALARRRLTRDLQTWMWEHAARDLATPLRRVVFHAAALLTAPVIERVRICPGAACGALFLDTSPGRGRRWCDMAVCGNRAKAGRYRAARPPDVTPSARGC